MIDFFDEDFPLTKKQEELRKAMEEAENQSSQPQPPSQAVLEGGSANPPAAENQPENIPAESAAPAVSPAIEEAEAVSEPAAGLEAPAENVPDNQDDIAPIAEVTEDASAPAEDVPQPDVEAVFNNPADDVSIAEVCDEPSDIREPEADVEAQAESIAESPADTAVVIETAEDISEPEDIIPQPEDNAAGDIPAEDEALPAEGVSAAEVLEEPSAICKPEAADEAPAEGVPQNPAEETAEAGIDAVPSEDTAADSESDDIRQIFTPDAESDNQEFSYEYDGRYFAEEETPAYRYGAVSTRRRSRPAKTADNGNITVNTKTLLKVGAIVAAAAAAIKLLGKKD